MKKFKSVVDDLKELRESGIKDHKIMTLENELNSLENEFNILNKKYIELLEDKGKAFDRYLDYKEKYALVYNDRKEIKKELALAKEKVTELEKELTKLSKPKKRKSAKQDTKTSN